MTATHGSTSDRTAAAGTPTGGAPVPSASGELSASRLQAMPDGSVRVLDVRTAGEFRTCHIPGAVNVPLDQLGRYREDLTKVNSPLVLVCQAGGRAAQAQTKLAEAGLTDLHVLAGGMIAWQQAEGDVVKGEQRWALERQVRLVAGSIVLLAVLASTVVPGLKWLAAFVGAGLVFAAVTNTCMMGNVLSKLPYNRGSQRDVERAVASLRSA